MIHKFQINRLLIIIVILAIGSVLRLALLSEHPKGFYPQEALLGYRALLLSDTGKDELNRARPLIFVSSQDYQLPVSVYSIVPFVRIAGLSKITVRLPFAIAGIFSIVGMFLLGRLLFKEGKNRDIPYILAVLMAINPWGVFLSRVPNPVMFGFTFFVFGLYFFLKRYGMKNMSYLLSILLFFLSLYSDKTAWIFILLFLLCILLANLGKVLLVSKRKIIFTILLLGILCLPLFISYTQLPQFGNSLKDNDLSLFIDIGIPNGINQMRGEDIVSGYPILGKIFYNKAFWITKLSSNILNHFVPRYYFSSGDQDPFHGLTNFGPLFLLLIVPGVVGVILLIKTKPALALIVFVWIFTASLPSALMSKSPDQVKFFYSIPAILIVITYGLKQIPKKLLFIIFPLLLFNMVYVYRDAINKEPMRNLQKWSTGFEAIATMIEESYQNYDNIFITNKYYADPIPLYLFSVKYSSNNYYSQLMSNNVAYRLWVNKVDKINAGELSDTTFNNFERNLFVVIPQEEDGIVPTINIKTGEPCNKIISDIKDEKGNTAVMFVTNYPGRCGVINEGINKL